MISYEEKQAIEQNKARVKLGLAPLPIKLRRCLKCGVTFHSAECRLCGECNTFNKSFNLYHDRFNQCAL